MMKNWYLAILVFVSLVLLTIGISFSKTSSPNKAFNATPDTIYLNWSNAYQDNVILTANDTTSQNITLEILNTTIFTTNYSQSNIQTACNNISLLVQNSTWGNLAGPLNGTSDYNTTTISLILNTFQCSPGRYLLEKLMIRNYTNSTENLNVSIILDVPISQNSSDNPLVNITGIGSFGSSKLPANATHYHSYFFNATSSADSYISNATSVVINLTGWASSQDVDLFLIDDSGNMESKSINKNTSEWLVYNYLPSSNQMWEIRLYGNSTNSSGISYKGYVIFGTLNITNASDTNQQMDMINFTSVSGYALNASNTSTMSIQLKNEGGINLAGVSEAKELYYVQTFSDSVSKNISILVPNSSIATKLKVSLNWTGESNYSFNVYKPDNSLSMSSMNKFKYANFTNVMQEEYNETTDISSTGNYWRIEVKNNTNATVDNYTLTAFVYVNASKWIFSNFSTFTFNTTGSPNSTYLEQINLTVPNDTLDGKYEGYLQYTASSDSAIRIPIEVTTKTPSLIVNNSLGSATITINENIGANLTKTLDVTYNNTGSYPVSFSHTNSSGILNLTSSSILRNITFDYNVSDTPIPAGDNGTINITISLNTILTGNVPGLYEGWIALITDSHPYQNFTLILRLNLTNSLIVTFNDIKTQDGDKTTTNSSAENVTLDFDITYINGTALGEPISINVSNFTAWLTSANVSYRIPTSGSLTLYNGTNPINIGGLYHLNVTIPNGSVGGIYKAYVNVTYNSLSGEGVSGSQEKYLTINNTGLYMSTNTSDIELYSNNWTYYFVNITNYGPVSSNPLSNKINFTRLTCSEYSVVGSTDYKSGAGCSISGTNPYNVTVPGNSFCIVWWKITAGSSGSGEYCSGKIYGNGSWYNTSSLSPRVKVRNTTTAPPTPPPVGPTYVANLNFTKVTSLILVQQNSSNYTDIQVQNTGNKTLNITFRLVGINSTWYSVNDTSESLVPNQKAGFRVTFTVGSETVGDYSGKYNASSTDKTITSNFTLRILPAPATQSEINNTLYFYKLDMIQLEEDINQSRENNLNMTIAEQKLAELKSMIADAENYIEQGDYFSANQLLDTIKNLIADIKTELTNATPVEGKGSRVLLYVGIGLGVAVVGVLAYLFWPTKSGPQYKGFRFKKKDVALEKLKEKYKKISGEKK